MSLPLPPTSSSAISLFGYLVFRYLLWPSLVSLATKRLACSTNLLTTPCGKSGRQLGFGRARLGSLCLPRNRSCWSTVRLPISSQTIVFHTGTTLATNWKSLACQQPPNTKLRCSLENTMARKFARVSIRSATIKTPGRSFCPLMRQELSPSSLPPATTAIR